MEPIKPKCEKFSLIGTGRYLIQKKKAMVPKIAVYGICSRPNRVVYQVINTGPTAKARVPPVLKMDRENPVRVPEYNGTIPVVDG